VQDLQRNPVKGNIELLQTSFFEGIEKETPDMVVFNPPWLPAESHTTIDKAMYYDAGFFETFFRQGFDSLQPHSVMVILFSGFAQVAGITSEHPIEKELGENQRFMLIEKKQRSIEQPPTARKNWLAQIRQKENAELWVLRKNP
jgi:methylase of polypeptide subunit release factors